MNAVREIFEVYGDFSSNRPNLLGRVPDGDKQQVCIVNKWTSFNNGDFCTEVKAKVLLTYKMKNATLDNTNSFYHVLQESEMNCLNAD